MSTTHGQPGLSSDQRSTIRSTILSARQTVEKELRRQLEKYGIQEDSRLSLEDLSHLSAEERHTRRTIDAAIERELESTEGDLERSITNYVREATKTYLNRFVALKTIEVRGFVEETITERPEYGNRSYMHHTVAEIAGELTNAPDDGFGAALDLAYQEIGAEIRMIFEESEHTAIDIDAQVREEVLDELGTINEDTWETDEALGWVYQYFGEKEREEIDDRIDEEGYKIAGTDVATKTQLFTPRYIVEWMVDNSLGRTWLEMQGDRTDINDEENCFYLAPSEDSLVDREMKSVEEITVLDPACGSGHMLFYAFDVLYQMYIEESDVVKKYIPREILRNNLYGIDIDSGAAQIAALSLFLKAKEKSPDVTIPQLNIVSADAVLINGDRKKEILERARSELEEDILEQIWRSFDNIREFGSLVRVEERIDEILEERRDEIQASGQVKFTEEGSFSTQSSFVSGKGEESWGQVKDRLLNEISNLASEALDRNDPIEEMFAGEVGKTVELLDLLIHEYDVVVSNPPYLGSGKMNPELKKFVRDNYAGKRDLYAAFIERCSELAGDNSYFSMITMENFMFLKSFKKLRELLLKRVNITEVSHLEHREDGYMNVCFTMRVSNKAEKPSRFNHLINEKNKQEALKQMYTQYSQGAIPSNGYMVSQKSFTEIENMPLVYWFGDEILSIIESSTKFEQHISSQSGIKTGNNSVFLRKFWEVDPSQIGSRYNRIVRSENKTDYFDQLSWLVDWKDDGEYIKQYGDEHGHQYFFGEEDRLGEHALGFIDMSTNLTAREILEDDLCSMQLYLVDPNDTSVDYLNGWLNSSLSKFIAKGFNPSMDFKQNDVYRLPYIEPTRNESKISRLARRGVEKVNKKYSLVETALQFDPSIFDQEIENVMNIQFHMDWADADRYVTSGIIDDLVFEEYSLSKRTIEHIYESVPNNVGQYPHVIENGSESGNHPEIIESVEINHYSTEDYSEIVGRIEELKGDELREIADDLEVSPYTIALVRHNHELYTDDEKEESAGRILSYYLGCILGRWESSNSMPSKSDGILVVDENSQEQVDQYVTDCLEATFDESYKIKNKISGFLGRGITEWIRERFFRYHHCKEYRRRGQRIPIYWQVESPDGAFSCFIYYHMIDANTLPKLRGQYLDPRINELENELETLNAQTSGDNPDKNLLNRKEEIQNKLDDIREFREIIDEMIDDGVTVDVEKGIWENIKEWDQYEVLETGLPRLKSSYSR